uniref:Uncharacterized protein n=1 Tax=viral metagenome TaxID=1070528 RepID=A0A6M3IKK3_9ZZZZ
MTNNLEPRHKIGDAVRIWKPGHAEHGLKGTVGKIITIQEYGGSEYRGPHAYYPQDGWLDTKDKQWFGGLLPEAMVCSEEKYQNAKLKSMSGWHWRR